MGKERHLQTEDKLNEKEKVKAQNKY